MSIIKRLVGRSVPVWVVALVIIVAISGTAAAAIAITDIGPTSLAAGSGDVESSNLSVDSYELQYTGNTVTDVNVTVGNSDTSTALSGDVEVALIGSGNAVATGSGTVTDVAASGQQTVTISVDDTSVDGFDSTEVTVIES